MINEMAGGGINEDSQNVRSRGEIMQIEEGERQQRRRLRNSQIFSCGLKATGGAVGIRRHGHEDNGMKGWQRLPRYFMDELTSRLRGDNL
jgi:hypothetical protein